MDRQFMMFFYHNTLPTPEEEALKGNIHYCKAEEKRQELEQKLKAIIDDAAWDAYLKLSDASGDVERILCEALYLKGAEDREKMLR